MGSRGRPLRLRWLLNALLDQTLEQSRWEVLVGHDLADGETHEVLASHPLGEAGSLRWRELGPDAASDCANRNAALAMARGRLVVLTRDVCRPPVNWLKNVLEAAQRHPGAVIQGPVVPDPEEYAILRSSHPRTQSFVTVPRVWGEASNIVYPRDLLLRLGGFDAELRSASEADLISRARVAGADYVGELAMTTCHCVQEGSVTDCWRAAWKSSDLAGLLKRHPGLRGQYTLGAFASVTHAWLPLALIGIASMPKNRRLGALVLPWALGAVRAGRHGTVFHRYRRRLLQLPALATIEVVEMTALARGSVRRRTLLL